MPKIGEGKTMASDSQSELEKRLEDMPLNKQLELVFKMLRENTKALEELKKTVDTLMREK